MRLHGFTALLTFLGRCSTLPVPTCGEDSCPIARLPICSTSNTTNESGKGVLKRRQDYRPLSYRVPHVELLFELGADTTVVYSKLTISRSENSNEPIVLYGSADLELLSLSIDDQHKTNLLPMIEEEGSEAICLSEDDHSLVITPDDSFFPPSADPKAFDLYLIVRNHPNRNTHLFGLYESDGLLVTQNEAQGFRRITYFPDRPDVLATFHVTLKADSETYPVLLSNGDLISYETDRNGEYHMATFYDPHPKPSYLFALVAGRLGKVEDDFVIQRPCEEAVMEFYDLSSEAEARQSAPHLMRYCDEFPQPDDLRPKTVKLTVWGKPGQESRLTWSLESIKKAMLYDEIVFGRYYDLSSFHVVSTRDFNAGAMENKGLNIFNAALVEADEQLTTDSQYVRIQGVIAHEYFHNWSGDRVTCRDWFQLSLKEGFTVYRDQLFTQDAFNTSSKRIDDVKFLTDVQFREDSGPLRHPIRPETYASIENFYTVTVYEKGAEIVRMYNTLLGWQDFRKGTDLYFSRYDGHAATCEDFLSSMEHASGKDLSQFSRWYNSSGTPVLTVQNLRYENKSVTLQVKQEVPVGGPLLIPLVIGLLSATGTSDVADTQTVEMTEAVQTFVFDDIPEEPVLAINRGFSAPILVKPYLNETQLLHQAQHDSCGYIRWAATQSIMHDAVVRQAASSDARGLLEHPELKTMMKTVLEKFLADDTGDLLAVAQQIKFPILASFERSFDPFDPDVVHTAIETVRLWVVKELNDLIWKAYDHAVELTSKFSEYRITTRQVGVRSLKNGLLALLAADKMDEKTENTILRQMEEALVENEAAVALAIGVHYPRSDFRDELLQTYRQRAGKEDLLINRWLAAQASSTASDTLDNVRRLAQLPLYSESKTPNRIRALLGAFAANSLRLNSADGAGYELVVDEIIRVDKFNPKVAARVAGALTHWGRLPDDRKVLIRAALRRLLGTPDLSTQTREIVTKALRADEAVRENPEVV